MSEPEDIRVQLARMEGKQDVTNERLDTANRINEERHAAMKARLDGIDTRLNGHGDRISGIERREAERGGERKGLISGGKAAWALVGAVPSGMIVAALMKMFGA